MEKYAWKLDKLSAKDSKVDASFLILGSFFLESFHKNYMPLALSASRVSKAVSTTLTACFNNFEETFFHRVRVIEWFGCKGPLKLIYSNLPAMSKDTFN